MNASDLTEIEEELRRFLRERADHGDDARTVRDRVRGRLDTELRDSADRRVVVDVGPAVGELRRPAQAVLPAAAGVMAVALAAAALAVLGRSDATPATVDDSPPTALPETTVAPASAPVPTVPTGESPESPESSEPRPMRSNLWLIGGYEYESQRFVVPVRLTASDPSNAHWKLLEELTNQLHLTFVPTAPTTGVPESEVPILVIGSPSAEASAEGMIDELLQWADETAGVDLEPREGDFAGRVVPVVIGTADRESPSGLQYYRMPLWGEEGLAIGYGQRRVEVYFVPVGDRVVAIKLEANPLQWESFLDAAWTLVESIEWS